MDVSCVIDCFDGDGILWWKFFDLLEGVIWVMFDVMMVSNGCCEFMEYLLRIVVFLLFD